MRRTPYTGPKHVARLLTRDELAALRCAERSGIGVSNDELGLLLDHVECVEAVATMQARRVADEARTAMDGEVEGLHQGVVVARVEQLGGRA